MLQLIGLALLLGVAAVLALLLWDKPVIILYTLVVYTSLFRLFRNLLGLPDTFKYLVDALIILLLIQLILNRKTAAQSGADLSKPLVATLLFALAAIVGYVGNLVASGASPVYFLWGIRRCLRIFVPFFAAATFMNKADMDGVFRYLLALLPINVALGSVQYFVWGMRNDYVGGTFGMELGCNTALNLYLIVVSAILVARGISGKLRILASMAGLALVLYLGAICELKALFFEVPMMLALGALFTRFNRRSIVMGAMGVGLAALAVSLFLLLYPTWADFFSSESIRYYIVEADYGAGNLNRLRVLPFVFGEVLLNLPQQLFGLSLGSTEYFLNFQSPFYTAYVHTRYYYFYYATLLLEVGTVGLVLLVLFHLIILAASLRAWRLAPTTDRTDACIVSIIICMCFLLFVYDSSLRTDTSPILYVVVALPYIMQKEYRALSPAAAKAGEAVRTPARCSPGP